MRRAMLMATVPTVAAPAFQARTTGGTTAATSITIEVTDLNPVAGDLIVIGIGGSRTSTTPTTVMTGYTKLVEKIQTQSTTGGILSVWGKIAGGSETDPLFNLTTGNTNMTYVAERWSGVGSLPGSGLTGNGYTTTSPAMTSNTVNTSVANSVVLTFIGGRGPATGAVSPSWGGGATGAYDTASGRLGFCNNATEVVASAASVTHTCSITNTQSPAISCIGSIVLAP